MPPDGALPRGLAFLALWLVLAGASPADLPAALLATAAATWVSLRLVPAAPRRIGWGALRHLVLHFPGQSLAAGAEIAWRALRPSLPLAPGMVSVPTRLPAGPARDAFCAYASLVPGTLPTGEDAATLHVHSLDTTRPVAADLAREEAIFAAAIGSSRDG